MGLVKKNAWYAINIMPLRLKHNCMLPLVVVENEWWFSRKA